ncbi:MAG: hypothetical protein IPK16_05890 [Anaerolineales bacterium]|nr:hypothetical protein [Anaerolineales bacterium]
MRTPNFDFAKPTGRDAGELEPGLLPVLRIVIGLQAAIWGLRMIGGLMHQAKEPPLTWWFVFTLPLLFAVFYPGLTERLGHWFLPVTLSYVHS